MNADALVGICRGSRHQVLASHDTVQKNALKGTEKIRESAMGVMEHLNWGYIQLGLVALIFGGLQVWWISSVLWRRNLAKPQSGGEFRKSLERIWKKEQQQR